MERVPYDSDPHYKDQFAKIARIVLYIFALTCMIYITAHTGYMLFTGKTFSTDASRQTLRDISHLKREVKRLRERRY